MGEMKNSKPIRLLVALTFCLSMAQLSQAAIVYQQKFNNTSGDPSIPTNPVDQRLDYVNWVGYGGSTGTPMTTTGVGTIYIPGGIGNPGADGAGFLAFNQLPNNNYVAYQTGLSIDPAAGPLSISWQQLANQAGLATTRLMLQVGGLWVASNQTFTPQLGSLADFGNVNNAGVYGQSMTFTLAGSAWRDVMIYPGIVLSVSGSTRGTDLSGTITGIGFYYETTGSVSMRMDDLTVTQVPEASAALLGLAGAGLMAVRRRR